MLYIVIATLAYAAAIVVSTLASRAANTTLVTAVINTVSAIIPLIVVIPFLSKGGLSTQRSGVLLAIVAGVLIAVFAMALNKSYSAVPVGVVAPIVFGGAIVLSTAASYIWLHEKVSLVQFIGLMLVTIGIGAIIYARMQTSS